MSLSQLLGEQFMSSQDTATHRVCGACNQLLPVENFYKDGKTPDGRTKYRRDCKSCYKKQRIIEARAKNPTNRKRGR